MLELSTQKRKSYTYKIIFEDGSFYYGVRKCPEGKTPFEDNKYFGSPKTHKEKWNTTRFSKIILKVFDNYAEAQEREKELIRPNLNNSRCLNESVGGFLSLESCREGGKMAGRKNVESG